MEVAAVNVKKSVVTERMDKPGFAINDSNTSRILDQRRKTHGNNGFARKSDNNYMGIIN